MTDKVFLTVVYEVPRKHAESFSADCTSSAHFSAASWSHALEDRDQARAALKAQPPAQCDRNSVIEEVASLFSAASMYQTTENGVINRIRSLKAQPAPTEAQGADSARLDAQVTAAARVLANRSADVCGVNRDDNWNVYGQEFIEDARAALDAAWASAETGGVKS